MVSTAPLGPLFLILFALAPTPIAAQIAKMELHDIASHSPTDQEFLTGKKDAKPATVRGELRLPRPGADKLPAVIVLHGSGGLTDREDIWAREFNALGIATLMIDSFTPRGIAATITNQDQLTRMAQVLDAYRGLELLAKHPRIDAARVAVIGFSRGGGAAHWAALKRFHAMHGPAGGLRLRDISHSTRPATATSSMRRRPLASLSASSTVRPTITFRWAAVAAMSSA